MTIEIDDLVKHYGEVKAVDRVSFSVEEGETFGLLGPNGAGKTTLMEILCGLRRFDHGKARINGSDLAEDSRKVRGMIGFFLTLTSWFFQWSRFLLFMSFTGLWFERSGV